MRITIGDTLRNSVYAFVYGREGVGKTSLVMTLADPKTKKGVAFITAERNGPSSLVTQGYPKDIPVEVLLPARDPFLDIVGSVKAFGADKTITAICLDGITVIAGYAIDFFSKGKGEKALGYDGWGKILTGFRQVEHALATVADAGKSVVLTSWEREPEWTPAPFDSSVRIVNEMGRPLIQGQAKHWLPGRCDIVARMTAHFTKQTVPGGKPKSVFKAELQVNASKEWFAKSRWALPDPCPANLAEIVRIAKQQREAALKSQ